MPERPNDIKKFINELVTLTNDSVSVLIDEPAEDYGQWWIDISHYNSKLETSLSWKNGLGFGIYDVESTDQDIYGERPYIHEIDPTVAAKKIADQILN